MTVILTVSDDCGARIDAYLSAELPNLSRSRLQTLIKEGHILLNKARTKPRTPLKAGDIITIEIPEEKSEIPQPQNIPLSILFEDDEVVVVNKVPGMVVHPATGNEDGTLVNALLYHCQGSLATEADDSRPGIVHRLDKDTSGCLVAAKTNEALHHLVGQFANRETSKLYLCVTQSPPTQDHQTVFNNIARHPVHRQRMDICNPGAGKPAITDLHLLQTADDGTSLVLCALHTGRTHQIRVHNRFLGHPLLGDPIYAKPARQAVATSRLMLHAWRLGFTHPTQRSWIQNEAPIPVEFRPWVEPIGEKLDKIRDLHQTGDLKTLW